MNFTENQKKFQQILYKGDGKTKSGKNKKLYHRGVYIFTREEDDRRYKIGMAFGESGMFERLKKQYRICYAYPGEFWIKFLVLTLEPSQSRKLEKKLLSVLKTIPNQVASKEWKITSTPEVLKQKLRKILNENKDLWFAVVVFSQQNMRVIDNTEEIGFSDLNKPSNRRAAKHRVTGFINEFD